MNTSLKTKRTLGYFLIANLALIIFFSCICMAACVTENLMSFHVSTGSSFRYSGPQPFNQPWTIDNIYLAGKFYGENHSTNVAQIYPDPDNPRMVSIDIGTVTWAKQRGGFAISNQYIPGDFDGDGDTDIAVIWNDAGKTTIDVYLSEESIRAFHHLNWLKQAHGFSPNNKFVAGDFDNDGLTDIAVIWNDANKASISLNKSTGNRFIHRSWAKQIGGYTYQNKYIPGDFDDDGDDDIAVIWNDANKTSISLYLQTGSGIIHRSWAKQMGGYSDQNKYIPGDFDGDGDDDIAVIWNDANKASISLYLQTDNGAIHRLWAKQQGSYKYGIKWIPMDAYDNGRMDLLRIDTQERCALFLFVLYPQFPTICFESCEVW